MAEIRFGCTGCGKCCNTPPMMTLREMLRLYEEFPFRLAIVGTGGDINGVGSAMVRRQMAHMRDTLGSLKVDTPDGGSFVMRLVPMPIGTPSSRQCEKLNTDGTCSIYDRRPVMCRTVPFDYMLPEVDQEFAFGRSKKEMESGKFECDTGPEAPVVWRDGAFLDNTEIGKSYATGVEISAAESGASLVLKAIMDGSLGLDPYDIINEILAGGITSIPSAMVVSMMLERPEAFGLSGDMPTLTQFLTAQINLCDRLIKENLKRKDARDREATGLLRDMVRLMNSMREAA